MVRPSAPIPRHLRHWQLSIIDQSSSQEFYGRILYLYSACGDTHRFANSNMSDRLKRSLSEALTDFYPLAGRYDSNKSVDCNDAGLEYIEARVAAPLTLARLLASPSAAELDALLPRDACSYGAGFEGPSAVQVTVFDACGGVAVGLSLSHALADAASAALFVNAWAANARRGTAAAFAKAAAVPFNFASLFPPRDILPTLPESVGLDTETETQMVPKKLAIKRFVFTRSKIEALKEKLEHERPTRVEAVSAVVFKCLINVSRVTSSRSVVLWRMADLRTRMTNPPAPAHYLGNMILTQATQKQTGIISPPLSELGMQLRKLVKEMDSEYLEKLQADDALLVWERMGQFLNACVDTTTRVFTLSSWCKFPFHEADFGWGSPTWAVPVFSTIGDVAVLVDGPNGGIEAWLTLDEDDMTRFESEFRHLTAAAPAGSVVISKL